MVTSILANRHRAAQRPVLAWISPPRPAGAAGGAPGRREPRAPGGDLPRPATGLPAAARRPRPLPRVSLFPPPYRGRRSGFRRVRPPANGFAPAFPRPASRGPTLFSHLPAESPARHPPVLRRAGSLDRGQSAAGPGRRWRKPGPGRPAPRAFQPQRPALPGYSTVRPGARPAFSTRLRPARRAFSTPFVPRSPQISPRRQTFPPPARHSPRLATISPPISCHSPPAFAPVNCHDYSLLSTFSTATPQAGNVYEFHRVQVARRVGANPPPVPRQRVGKNAWTRRQGSC